MSWFTASKCAADVLEGLHGVARMQVYQGRHLQRDMAVKVLQLDGNSTRAVQREVRRS